MGDRDGPGLLQLRWNIGITLRLRPGRCRNRTAIRPPVRRGAGETVKQLARRLGGPIAEIGSTALSVELSTKRFTPSARQTMTFCERGRRWSSRLGGECSTSAVTLRALVEDHVRAGAVRVTASRPPMGADGRQDELSSPRRRLAVRSASSRFRSTRELLVVVDACYEARADVRIWRTSRCRSIAAARHQNAGPLR